MLQQQEERYINIESRLIKSTMLVDKDRPSGLFKKITDQDFKYLTVAKKLPFISLMEILRTRCVLKKEGSNSKWGGTDACPPSVDHQVLAGDMFGIL